MRQAKFIYYVGSNDVSMPVVERKMQAKQIRS